MHFDYVALVDTPVGWRLKYGRSGVPSVRIPHLVEDTQAYTLLMWDSPPVTAEAHMHHELKQWRWRDHDSRPGYSEIYVPARFVCDRIMHEISLVQMDEVSRIARGPFLWNVPGLGAVSRSRALSPVPRDSWVATTQLWLDTVHLRWTNPAIARHLVV
jgi:hypothetical protein